MNALSLLNQPVVFIEIGPATLKALTGDTGIELPLDRSPNGRLTDACRARLTQALQSFVGRKGWQPRLRAFCAIGARGVSLRRMALPSSTKEELRRVLLLQIESEFPLPPDELAWGYRPLSRPPAVAGTAAMQDVLVAAVKKEVVEEYAELFAACGLNPVFTIAALARSHMCPQAGASYAVLDIGREQSEWASFDHGVPAAVRVLPWGREDFARTVAERLRLSRDEAERLLGQPDLALGEQRERLQDAVNTSLDSLAGAINGRREVRWLYLTGEACGPRDMPARISERLGGGACERIEIAPGEGRSAAVLGLKKSVEQNGGSLPLTLMVKAANGSSVFARPQPTKWLKLAAALAAAALLLPYAEAAVMKLFVSSRMKALDAQTNTLVAIESEFAFLQYLKKNELPYLDALYLLSKSAPGGTKFESITINRRGDLALRGSFAQGQVVDFRAKLVDSGFFSTVVVEEQTPTPDRQKVTVRLSAQWKVAEARPKLKVESPPKELQPSGPMNMPPGMPAGVSPAEMPAGKQPGVNLPAGVSLPPGVTLPPGVNLPSASSASEAVPSSAARGRPRPQPTTPPTDQ